MVTYLYTDESKIVFSAHGEEMEFNYMECIQCGQCEPECPTDAIRLVDGGFTDNNGVFHITDSWFYFIPNNCTACKDCADVCPTDVIRFVAPPPNPGGGDGDGDGNNGTNNDDEEKIKEFLNDPCIKEAFRKAVNKARQNGILEFYREVLGNADNVSIEFYEAHNGNTEFGHARLTRMGENMLIYVTLNLDLLHGSSQELITATIYHEILHAVFDARKVLTNDILTWSEAFAHHIMSAAYINKMTLALREIFPGLSHDDAEALSWGGLEGTPAWTNLSPADANARLLRADQFEIGKPKGLRCAQ